MDDLLKYGSCFITPPLSPHSYSNTTVYVVGCGGTGGRLIPQLAQYIVNHNTEIATNPRHKQFLKHQIKLVLIDDDIVETKNLRRQNFFKFDVGKNKAQIFAERYSALCGMDIVYHDKRISETCNPFGYAENTIIFDCTDNVKARRAIENATAKNICNNRVIISCGNEDTFGQVLLSCNTTSDPYSTGHVGKISELLNMIKNPNFKAKKSFNHLPSLLEIYRDFKDTEAPSCTEVQLADEQSMPVNNLVATLAYNVFYNLVGGQQFKYNMVKCSINNVYTTNMIANPLALYDLYVRGLFGDTSDAAYAAVEGFIEYFDKRPSYDKFTYEPFIEEANKYGKYAAPFADMVLNKNWRLKPDQTAELNRITNLLRGE